MERSPSRISGYFQREHSAAFQLLLEVFSKFSLKYYLIGAQAKNLIFSQEGIKPNRGTRDVDFAIMVDSMDQYHAIVETLVQGGFALTNEPHRLNWNKGETVFDLLPFGRVEEAYTVRFDERDIELNMLGFSQLVDEVVQIPAGLEGIDSLPVPPLHGIFLLKLLSWNDKKNERERDLKDISQILENYWSFVESEAFESHLDLFDDQFSMDLAGVRILGRNLGKTLKKSDYLKNLVISILNEQSQTIDSPSLMMEKLAGDRGRSLKDVKDWLDSLLLGIEDAANSA